MTFDDIQLEETGNPAVLKLQITNNERLLIDSIRFTFSDNITGITTVAGATENATMVNLPCNKILGLAKLTNGIVFQEVKDGIAQSSSTLTRLADFLEIGGDITNIIGDGTNAFVTVDIHFKNPIRVNGDIENNFLSLTINDDLSSLILFTANAKGAAEV